MSALKSDTHENREDQRDAKLEFKSELKTHVALHFSFFFNMLNKARADGVQQQGKMRRYRGRRCCPLKCCFAFAAGKQKSFVASESFNRTEDRDTAAQDRETDALVRRVLPKPLSQALVGEPGDKPTINE